MLWLRSWSFGRLTASKPMSTLMTHSLLSLGRDVPAGTQKGKNTKQKIDDKETIFSLFFLTSLICFIMIHALSLLYPCEQLSQFNTQSSLQEFSLFSKWTQLVRAERVSLDKAHVPLCLCPLPSLSTHCISKYFVNKQIDPLDIVLMLYAVE